MKTWLLFSLTCLFLAACAPNPQTAQVNMATVKGTARFRDRIATADQFALQLTGVPAPPNGLAYDGWLVSDDGVTLVSVGLLKVNGDSTVALEWNSPSSENLLSRYSRFQITLESVNGSAKPTGAIVLAGGFSADALAEARKLFARNLQTSAAANATNTPVATDTPVPLDDYGNPIVDPNMNMSTNPNATPFETPYALGLKQQTIIADEHAQNALNAAAIGSLDQMRFHLEHIINILEGLQGARYGDYDGNGRAENPGDGFGVRAYANEIVNHTTALSNHAQTQATMEEAQNQITAIEDQCIALFAVTSTSAATNTLKDIKTLTDQLRDGPISKLYQEAQDALVFNVGPLTNP